MNKEVVMIVLGVGVGILVLFVNEVDILIIWVEELIKFIIIYGGKIEEKKRIVYRLSE